MEATSLRRDVLRKVTLLADDGGWRMEDGGWRMEDGGWRMEDGGWRMEDGGWRMEDRMSRKNNKSEFQKRGVRKRCKKQY